MLASTTARWVLAFGAALANGCATAPPEPWALAAAHATGDGRSPATAVSFGPLAGEPLVFVMAELTWLQSHGYTRIAGTDATSAWTAAPPRILHVWAVRDINGRMQSIYFDKTQMSAKPSVDGRPPAG